MNKSQLYLWDGIRNKKVDEIKLYQRTFVDKIYCVFDSLEDEAEHISKTYLEEQTKFFNPEGNFDLESIIDEARGLGFDYYESYSLMRYNTLAMWTTMLYQMWEQQVRLFLYEEERHYFELEFREFCSNGINGIKNEFKFHNFDIEKLKSWSKINELRLIANVFKHGDGGSAIALQKLRPEIFNDADFNKYDMLTLYNTTLLEKVVNIDDEDYVVYCKALIDFWIELPERMYSDVFK